MTRLGILASAMAPLIEQNRDAIAALCRRYGVTRLDVFGSAARGDDFDPATSDADFLYEIVDSETLVDRFFDFKDALEALLGREVDLVTARRYHLNPYFAESVNRDRKPLYAA